MACRNEPLEHAIYELTKASVKYRVQETRDGHSQVFVEGSPMIVTISSKSGDTRLLMNVRRDIRKAIALRNVGK